jgi:hypothetical protein
VLRGGGLGRPGLGARLRLAPWAAGDSAGKACLRLEWATVRKGNGPHGVQGDTGNGPVREMARTLAVRKGNGPHGVQRTHMPW